MDIGARLGDRLRTIRKVRRLSQEALAASAGLDQGVISRLEAGSYGVSSLQKVADGLQKAGIDIDDLLSPAWVDDPQVAEAARLLASMEPRVRDGILDMLHRLAGPAEVAKKA